jgi:hypothetical protein
MADNNKLSKPGLIPIKVENQGSLITTQVNKINFTGSGVTASVGQFNDLTILITGGGGSGVSSSYALSASFAATASYFSGSISNAISSSYALTASYFSGSISNAVSSSYALSASYAATASYFSGSISNAVSSSYALTASYWSGSILNATSASYAANGGVTQLLAGANISLSPTNGLGQVTITSTGGSGGSGNTATGSYGSFYSTQTQTNVAGTARSMSLNVTDITNGVSVSGSTNPFNTYIKVENPGVYDIQFSAQVDKTDSGTDEIWIWIRKNGTDISDSATSIELVGNGAHYVAAWNFFVNAAANDYFQLMWYSPDANVRLHAESAFGVVPGIPSLIVTANRVDQFLSNTGSFSGSFTGSFVGLFTGSLLGTSSWAASASQAISSSFTLNAISASYALSSSFAITSSYARTASYVNPLTQSLLISGSTTITGSTNISGGFNLTGDINASSDTIILNSPSIALPGLALPYSPSPTVRTVLFDTANNVLFVTSSLPGGGGGGNATYISTGSITASVNVTDLFLIQSSSRELLKFNNQGVMVMEAYYTTPTAITGGFMYSASGDFFVGL